MVPVMVGKLDEISRAIGALEAGVGGLKGTFEQHANDDDRRHSENLEALKGIGKSMAELSAAVAPLATTVKRLEPICEDYEKSKHRFIGMFLAFSGLASGIGYFASELKLWLFKH